MLKRYIKLALQERNKERKKKGELKVILKQSSGGVENYTVLETTFIVRLQSLSPLRGRSSRSLVLV